MATTYTTNYNLGKQENHADKFDMDVITDNADKIDAALTGLQSSIDGKQATLTAAQLAAVNSGITAEKLAQDENNISSLIDSTYGTAHNVDLDTLTKGGRYLVNGAESSTSNAPFANWQIIEVYESNIEGYTTLTVQIATELGAGLARKFRRRTYSGGGQYSAWTAWTS